MNLFARFASWVAAKAAPSPYATGGYGPYGGAGGGAPYLDAFYRHAAPTPLQLLNENLGTAYACGMLNADLVATTPLRLFVTTGRGEAQSKMSRRGETAAIGKRTLSRLKASPPAGSRVREAQRVEEVLSHPLLSLLNRPTPMADGVGLSLYELFNFTQLYQEVVGRAYWKLDLDGLGGTPTAIWILASHQVREVCDPSSDRIIDYYEFGGGGRRERYQPGEVVPFRMPDLRNPYLGGMSPLRAVIEQVRIVRKTDAHTGALLDNMARPDSLFIPKGSDAGFDIGEHAAARLEAYINKRFRAGGRGGVMVAEHDGQLVPLQWPARDVMDLEQAKLAKTQIANAYGVPSSKLDRNDANLASAKTGDYAHAKDAGVPRCRRVEAALNAFFVPMWDPTGRLFLAYDSPIPDDRDADREDRKVLVSAYAVTRGELRDEAGLEQRDDMDAPLAPSNVVAVDDQGKPVPAAPTSAINLNLPGGGGGKDDPTQTDPPEHQADAVASTDLKATVGGSQAVLALQEAFYAGQMPRDAAIANATLVFGFTPEQAQDLFPDQEPENKPEPEPEPQNQPADDGEETPPPGGKKGLNSGRGKAMSGGGEIVGNVGKDGLAGPLPQGESLEAALKSLFAQQRSAVLKEITGKSLDDVERKLIDACAAAGKAFGDAGQLHAFVRLAGARGKNEAKKNPDDPDATPAPDPLSPLPTAFVDLSDWDATIADAVRPLIEVIVAQGAKETVARVGASADVFKVVEKNVPQAVEQMALRFAHATNQTTSLEINEAISTLRDELTAGLVEGDTRAEMTARVKSVFDRAEDWRAGMIAKTEASRAQHAGEVMSAKASGVVGKKKWLRSADACPICDAIAETYPDGVDLEGNFGVTKFGPIDHPPAHPNCQCSETFVLAGPSDAA